MSRQATLFRAWGGSKKPQRDGSTLNEKKKVPPRLKSVQTASSASNLGPRCGSTTANVNTACVGLTSAKTEQQGRAQKEQYGFSHVQELEDFFEDDISEELTRSESHPATRDDPVSTHNTSILEDVPGFDAEAGRQWIYPVNYPIRDYQFNIVQKCLFKNTLVCLPTGLGKTFIAAVVMFNFYRWYPSGKVVFLAPTKPLVGQQIEACHNIMGIPQTHLAEMTGTKSSLSPFIPLLSFPPSLPPYIHQSVHPSVCLFPSLSYATHPYPVSSVCVCVCVFHREHGPKRACLPVGLQESVLPDASGDAE